MYLVYYVDLTDGEQEFHLYGMFDRWAQAVEAQSKAVDSMKFGYDAYSFGISFLPKNKFVVDFETSWGIKE